MGTFEWNESDRRLESLQDCWEFFDLFRPPLDGVAGWDFSITYNFEN